jgi:SNF2 family DNA or RNA helicase
MFYISNFYSEGVFMFVYTESDFAIVKCQFQEKELVKAIGDFKFDKATAAWKFPLRKLVDIIDNLNIGYDPETKIIYDHLVQEKQRYHSLLNKADRIKRGEGEWDILDQDKISLLNSCYNHQKQAIILGSLFDSYAFFMETGTGKSLVAIKLIEFWKVPAMVVCPLSTIESVWQKEIEKWSNLNSVILWQNLKAFEYDYNVYLINYEQFKILSGKTDISKRIRCLVIDESSKLKNPKSQITKAALKYQSSIPHRLCLTGTPAPNNLLEYHSQMAFINPELLGENYYRFRNTFFFSYGYGGYQYKPMKGAQEAIIDRVSRQAFSIRKEDCLDLPDRVFETRLVYMDETQQKAYDMMKKENILEFGDSVTLAANELAKLMKLRQVTSGFTINNQGIPVLIADTKINALKDLLEEIPEDKQVIIWLNFHFEIHRLKEEFKDIACTLYGDMPQKAKNQSIKDFQDGKYRILLAHPLSGGLGLTFTNCHYVIWYSLNYSQEQYSQANDRVYRIGQKNKVTYFLLLAKDTIDEIIYKVLDKKADLMNACLEMLKGKNGITH